MEREQITFDPNPIPKLDIQIIPEILKLKIRGVAKTTLGITLLTTLSGCTPEEKISMIGAGAFAAFFTLVSLTSLRSDDDTRRKNQQRRINRYQDGQKLLAPDKGKPIWQIPNGVMAKYDYTQLRKKHQDASHDQLVAYIGEHGKSHIFDR